MQLPGPVPRVLRALRPQAGALANAREAVDRDRAAADARRESSDLGSSSQLAGLSEGLVLTDEERDRAADVRPAEGFAAAAGDALALLQQRHGLDLWMVTQVRDGEQRVVVARGVVGMPVPPGAVQPWAESYCRLMVAGKAPRVAPRSKDVPSYAACTASARWGIAAYVGVPLLAADGTLFGTLCALSAKEQPASLVDALPEVELVARLLSTVLAKETAALERSYEAAQAYARVDRDAVTGLLNARGWQTRLLVEEERCRRHDRTGSVVALDLAGRRRGAADGRLGPAADLPLGRRAGPHRTGAARRARRRVRPVAGPRAGRAARPGAGRRGAARRAVGGRPQRRRRPDHGLAGSGPHRVGAPPGPARGRLEPVTPDSATTWRPHLPVDVRRTLSPLSRGRADPTHQLTPDGALWRTTRTPAGAATVRLTQRGLHEVDCAAWGPGAQEAVAGLPDLLGARDDASAFAPGHPLLADAHARHPGLRIPRTGRVVEALVPAVLEQKVTGKEARSAFRWLVARYGEPAPGPAPAGMRVPPPAEVWRRVPSWDWHRAGVDPKRARTVLAAVQVAERLEECVGMEPRVGLPAADARAGDRALDRCRGGPAGSRRRRRAERRGLPPGVVRGVGAGRSAGRRRRHGGAARAVAAAPLPRRPAAGVQRRAQAPLRPADDGPGPPGALGGRRAGGPGGWARPHGSADDHG